MHKEDRGGRKNRGDEEEGEEHSWPNALSNRFQPVSCAMSSLQRECGGRQKRKESWREERNCVWMKGGGRVTQNSWVEANRALSVCMLILAIHALFSTLPPPWSHLGNICSNHLDLHPSVTPCQPGSLGAIKHLTGRVSQLALLSNGWTHKRIFTQNTHALDHMQYYIFF